MHIGMISTNIVKSVIFLLTQHALVLFTVIELNCTVAHTSFSANKLNLASSTNLLPTARGQVKHVGIV